MEALLTTLCYIEKDEQYLMLHRISKKKDVNKDKWIGVGGKFEQDESPEECLLREVWEETGYRLTSWQFRGLVTFVCAGATTEYMCLYTADGFEGEPRSCEEGVLEWVPKDKVLSLNIWEGDRIFLKLLKDSHPWFSLKVIYGEDGKLCGAELDGKPVRMEEFD
ncbi:MAG: 8-oxo-dGTP diphosphatase [Eubacteriales bacterium]|nr:8-oxo-dGTP diphosphatase [Eubacteriales bacterium]